MEHHSLKALSNPNEQRLSHEQLQLSIIEFNWLTMPRFILTDLFALNLWDFIFDGSLQSRF